MLNISKYVHTIYIYTCIDKLSHVKRCICIYVFITYQSNMIIYTHNIQVLCIIHCDIERVYIKYQIGIISVSNSFHINIYVMFYILYHSDYILLNIFKHIYI